MKLNEYEEKCLEEINDWERNKHKGFHKKILEITAKPIDFIIRKIGEKKLRVFEKVILEAINKLLKASTHTVDFKDIRKRAKEHGIVINSISDLYLCDLQLLDQCNDLHIQFHKRAAAIQGMASGLGGALLASADLTTILIEVFHLLQEVALCYGFDPITPFEKEIILRIIEIGLGHSKVKFKGLEEIEKLKQESKSNTQAKGVLLIGAKALEDYIEELTVVLVVRLAKRFVPIISMAVSAHSNYEIMEHTGETAFMVYRKRFIERKRELRR